METDVIGVSVIQVESSGSAEMKTTSDGGGGGASKGPQGGCVN